MEVNSWGFLAVTWMKGLKDITDSLRSMKWTSDDYVRLTLKRANLDDAGTYCIMAKNKHGTDRAFFTVRLRERAKSLTPTMPVECILDEIPSYRERLYRKDVPSGIPEKPKIKDSGRNWVSLTWNKPDQTSIAPVLGYRVDVWHKGSDGGAQWNTLGMCGLCSFDAFNLVSGGEYQFRITPRNR